MGITLDEVSKDRITTITMDASQALMMAHKVTEAMGSIPKKITTVVETNYVSTGSSSLKAFIEANRQSGGTIRDNAFASDLNIPLFKGEAVLPAPVVKAIKEGRGSFAGLGGGGSNVNLTVNVTGNNIAEPADEDRLADKVGNKIIQNLRLQGTLTG